MTAATLTLTCRKCGHAGPLEDFVKAKRSKYGRDRICKPCVAAHVRRWARDNPEKVKAAAARWTQANPERRREINRVWAQKNYVPRPRVKFTEEEMKQRRRDQDQRRYEKERARRVAQAREWAAANPDRAREIARFAAQRRRQRLAVGRFGSIEPAVLAAKIAFWGDRCWICHGEWSQIDHVKPVARGGRHLLANLRPICGHCNRRKSARWPLSDVTALAERIRHERTLGGRVPISRSGA